MTDPLRETDPMLVVAAAMIDDAGRVLIQQRPATKQHGGLWEFPGGKVEPGEAPAAALARELAEELAITVDPAAAMPLGFAWRAGSATIAAGGAGAARPLLLLLYALRRWTGSPRAIEASAIDWVGGDALDRYAMPPADRELCTPVRAALSEPTSPTSGQDREVERVEQDAPGAIEFGP